MNSINQILLEDTTQNMNNLAIKALQSYKRVIYEMEKCVDILYRVLLQKDSNKYDISTLNSFKKILDSAKIKANNLSVQEFKNNYRTIFATYNKYIKIFHIKVVVIGKKHNVNEVLPLFKELPEYITQFQIDISDFMLSQGNVIVNKLEQKVNYESIDNIDINKVIKNKSLLLFEDDENFEWDKNTSTLGNVLNYIIYVLKWYTRRIKNLNTEMTELKNETGATKGTANEMWDSIAKFFGYCDEKTGKPTITFDKWIQDIIERISNWLGDKSIVDKG